MKPSSIRLNPDTWLTILRDWAESKLLGEGDITVIIHTGESKPNTPPDITVARDNEVTYVDADTGQKVKLPE